MPHACGAMPRYRHGTTTLPTAPPRRPPARGRAPRSRTVHPLRTTAPCLITSLPPPTHTPNSPASPLSARAPPPPHRLHSSWTSPPAIATATPPASTPSLRAPTSRAPPASASSCPPSSPTRPPTTPAAAAPPPSATPPSLPPAALSSPRRPPPCPRWQSPAGGRSNTSPRRRSRGAATAPIRILRGGRGRHMGPRPPGAPVGHMGPRGCTTRAG